MHGFPFVRSQKVVRAHRDGKPVVALESAIISHGLPWPANYETYRAMEEAVREEGAEPATIALLEGRIHIGLENGHLDELARGEAVKAGARDLPALARARASAGTTVSATIFLAHRAGINIMATGGIGGVHRDWAESGDASADLWELSRTPVAVVCSGVKTILDLPRTVEALESLGVPAIGYRTAEWPAFYSRKSGIPLEHRVHNIRQTALWLESCRRLGMPGGSLILNPVPPKAALDLGELEMMIEEALHQARLEQISGKAVTPFLLSWIQKKSQGGALKANQALAASNARLAARIARELDAGGEQRKRGGTGSGAVY
ncbi:MAG: pseudouridine-5'-phosphate glycosidase [Acidobacteriota bacterium]